MILQGDDRVARVLVPDDELVVDWRGHPLLWVALADAGVKEARPTVGSGDSAAGEDVFLTFVQRGPEGDREVFPVHQVATAGVAPVHVAPGGAVRIELVEEVVPAFVEDAAVGMVNPVGRRMEMIDRPVGVGRGRGNGRGDRLHRLLHFRVSLWVWERGAGGECAGGADAGESAAGQMHAYRLSPGR